MRRRKRTRERERERGSEGVNYFVWLAVQFKIGWFIGIKKIFGAEK